MITLLEASDTCNSATEAGALTLDPAALALATNCVLTCEDSKADCVWTREEFLAICAHMLHGNAPMDFKLFYRDRKNQPRFGSDISAPPAL